MSLADYLEGSVYLLALGGVLAAATLLIVRRHLGHLTGAEAIAAYALIATLALLAVQIVPMALGVLSRGAVLVSALALVLVAWLVHQRGRIEDPAGPQPPPSGAISTWVAAAAVGVAVVFELARLRTVAVLPIDHIDMLNFHLPAVARWMQSGSIWQIDQLFPLFTTGYYPESGDVVSMAAILPWHEADFARLIIVPFLAFAGVAVYALALQLGSARATAATFASAATLMPALAHEALEGLPDVVMLFALATAATFLVRHARASEATDLILAGLALGVAFGTRWQGVTSVAAMLAVWAAAVLLWRRSRLPVVRAGTGLLILTLLAGGIWMLRNLIEGGNPLYPQPISVLGVTLFDGPEGTLLDRFGFTIASYLGDFGIVRDYFIPGLMRRLALTGPLVLVGVALAFGHRLAGWRRARSLTLEEAATLAVGVAALAICALYAITPASAGGPPGQPTEMGTTVRWLVPAPMLAAAAAAAAFTRLPRALLLGELAALIAVLDGVRREPDTVAGTISASAIAEALAAAAALTLVGVALYHRRDRLSSLAPRTRVAAIAAVLALVLITGLVGGRLIETRHSSIGYSGRDPTLAWIEANAPADAGIGLASIWSNVGISPIFPAFGQRLDNRVEYVGRVEDGLLREYSSREPFLAAIERADYDLLEIGLGFNPRRSVREERWARAAGFREVANSDRLVLYVRPSTGTD